MSHHDDNRSIATAEWVWDNLERFQRDEPEHRLLEVDMEPDVYDEGHIPGAVKVDREGDIAGQLGSELLSCQELEALMGGVGATEETSIVVYGDKANWFAAHAYWVLSYYGHEDVRLMDGDRHYWLMNDYPITTEVPSFTAREYSASEGIEGIRAYKDEVMAAVEDEASIIDVRNPQECRGEKPPADIPDTTPKEGHIPGAENVPWGEAVNMDGTFKPEEELRAVYDPVTGNGEDETVAYCRIGERSSLTWFVLHELLDVDASNYDGSWTEWAQEDLPAERVEPPEPPESVERATGPSTGGGD